MSRVVAIRFRRAEKVYFFEPGDLELRPHEQVVVETEKGLELGCVVAPPKELEEERKEPLKPVVRRATEEDVRRRVELDQRVPEALAVARRMAENLSLPMKMLDAHYTLDGERVIIYFGAEQRVDFRQLLRQLGEALHARVELRQVGSRDEAKFLGGLGRCGRVLCCALWLTEFCPVTVRMAKEQSLPVSAEGLAGQCGRLRCCLRFEYEQYVAANKALPRIGEKVITPYGPGKVIVGHPLKETVSVLIEGGVVKELSLEQVRTQSASTG
jgi:cell fate regulator YaaT (PSP1 superfamily)